MASATAQRSRPLAAARRFNISCDSLLSHGSSVCSVTDNCEASGAGSTDTTRRHCSRSSPNSPARTSPNVSATWLHSCRTLWFCLWRFFSASEKLTRVHSVVFVELAAMRKHSLARTLIECHICSHRIRRGAPLRAVKVQGIKRSVVVRARLPGERQLPQQKARARRRSGACLELHRRLLWGWGFGKDQSGQGRP